jgi:acetyl-CoA carboxylase carboxyl transferase subunit alpha
MADHHELDFEQPLEEIRRRIEELRATAEQSTFDLSREIEAMEEQYQSMARRVYSNLTAWQEVKVARHPLRPQTRDYLRTVFTDFLELHGDRAYRDDTAIVTGFATIGEHRVMLVGEHKGRTIEERHLCFAGCPHPEGYRKALLKMELAERFGLPVVTFIDTKGAYPGTGGEERGVGPAIAENLRAMSGLTVPIIVVVIGEGGSGGALGIGVGDRVLMLQHAYYSVISPEGCAAILWRDREKAPQAAAALKLTSRDLQKLGLIDEVVGEPIGGAHKNAGAMGRILRDAILRHLDELAGRPGEELVAERYRRLRAVGEWEEATESRLAEILGPREEPAAAPPAAVNADADADATAEPEADAAAKEDAESGEADGRSDA